MSISSPITQRVVTQQPRSDVVFHAESSDGAFAENGIHVNFETASFYTKRAGSDAIVYNRIQDMFTFTGGNQSKYRGSNGLLQSSVTNTPRLEFSSSTIGTNLLTQSQTIDAANWAKSATSVIANSDVAPDGTTTADKVVEDTATISHFVQNTNTGFVSGQTYTLSAYVKAAGRNFVLIQGGALAFTTGTGGWFNLSTGAFGTLQNAPTATTVQNVGNGWYRISFTKTATATTGAGFNIYACNADGATAYTGDGSSGILLWGVQIEIASSPSQYTATTAAVPAYTNSTPVFLGMLMEASRTNLCLQSQDLATTWQNDGSSETVDTIAAPDGTTTADTIVENAAAAATPQPLSGLD
jgi:hypothetical protein